jgi:hypothetical protein
MNRISQTARALTLLLPLLGAATVSLQAQASGQLTRISNGLARTGFDEVTRREGWLHDDETESTWFELEGGVEYVFAGTCDADCSDLDLEVFNSRGTRVAADTGIDDIPRVSYRPSVSGRYRLEVTMYRCSIEPCEFRVGVFSR